MREEFIDCLSIHEKIKLEVRNYLLTSCNGFKPLFIIISVGDNQANKRYINQKLKHCSDVGIHARHIALPSTITESELISIIKDYQEYANAIIIQLPIDSINAIDRNKVLNVIDPLKDVDGLTIMNTGLLHNQLTDLALIPATPLGVMGIFENINYDLSGKRVLIIGRSNLVGRPLQELMLQKDANVSLIHSKTNQSDLRMGIQGTSRFTHDVIISAVGKPKFITNAKADVLIDVGINELDGKLVGDIDLASCQYNYATTVPKGVGLCTTAYLLQNVLKACKLQGVIQ